MALAREGRVLVPLRPPHTLMSFFTLAANVDAPCATEGPGSIVGLEAGMRMIDDPIAFLPDEPEARLQAVLTLAKGLREAKGSPSAEADMLPAS